MLFRIKAGDREFYLVRASERPAFTGRLYSATAGIEGRFRCAFHNRATGSDTNG